jgi:hypothetical protein
VSSATPKAPLLLYEQGTGDYGFDRQLMSGTSELEGTFFLSDGTPRYYGSRRFPSTSNIALRRSMALLSSTTSLLTV